QGPVKPEVLSIQLSGRRSNRRLQRNNSLSPNNPLLSLVNSGVYDEDCQWTIQVNRLQKLIDRLEQKEIRMEPVEEEVLESKSHILIVQRQLTVLEEELEEFRLALRQYMDCACVQTGCLQSVHVLFIILSHLLHLREVVNNCGVEGKKNSV
ncbi:hypothetical protein ATANTOWER_010685, partial [Ataeniobius toweri]|nr:hypothetical protein [Ataeniobius toweri]